MACFILLINFQYKAIISRNLSLKETEYASRLTYAYVLFRWNIFTKENGIIPIKGVEINAKFQNQVLHILGYGFEDTEELLAVLKHADDEME